MNVVNRNVGDTNFIIFHSNETTFYFIRIYSFIYILFYTCIVSSLRHRVYRLIFVGEKNNETRKKETLSFSFIASKEIMYFEIFINFLPFRVEKKKENF